jgi:hypothetical protein
VKIKKTEYAVFVFYKLESTYKKSSKFEEVMVQNQKKMSDLKWNASSTDYITYLVILNFEKHTHQNN